MRPTISWLVIGMTLAAVAAFTPTSSAETVLTVRATRSTPVHVELAPGMHTINATGTWVYDTSYPAGTRDADADCFTTGSGWSDGNLELQISKDNGPFQDLWQGPCDATQHQYQTVVACTSACVLSFVINDCCYSDNSGELIVTIALQEAVPADGTIVERTVTQGTHTIYAEGTWTYDVRYPQGTREADAECHTTGGEWTDGSLQLAVAEVGQPWSSPWIGSCNAEQHRYVAPFTCLSVTCTLRFQIQDGNYADNAGSIRLRLG